MKRKMQSSKESKSSKKMKKKILNTRGVTSPTHAGEIITFDQAETFPGTVEESSWGNLELILSLQNRELGIEKKVDLAFSFVNAHEGDRDEECEAIKMARLICFISDWIQSLLISTEKKFNLDLKCWEVFRFCLKESSNLNTSLSLSRNLLKTIGYVAENLLSLLNTSLVSEERFTGQGFEVYSSVFDCVGLLFSSKSGFFNDNLDLWFSMVKPVLKLTSKVLADNIKDGFVTVSVLQFSCLVLEPFSSFLKIHPGKKKGFRDFLDKIFEPVLDLLGLLHLCVNENDITSGSRTILMKFVKEIISYGLFHSTHIDGFLGLRGTERFMPSEEEKAEENKTVMKSYHRYLFDKLESFLSSKHESELGCLGDLFSLFINRVAKLQRASNQVTAGMDTSKTKEVPTNSMHKDTVKNDIDPFCSGKYLNAETRKSLFDFFLHLMEPIVLEMDAYVRSGSEMTSDIYCVLKAANSLLSSLAHERIYVKTEDISGGACLCFLKKIFTTLVSVASYLRKRCKDDGGSEMLVSSAKELITAIGYLLDIEYEVIENDLVNWWVIILSFMDINLSVEDSHDEYPLMSLIVSCGCQLISLFSELRQVNSAVYALCKAVRLTLHGVGDYGEMFFLEKSAKSVERLFSSQDLKLAIHKAIKSIPEGQTSSCIKSLTTDLSETMEWIKMNCSTGVRKQHVMVAELLTGALSEIYSLVLNSLTITTGNSALVGLSINNLMDVISPHLSCLVSSREDCVETFVTAVTGKCMDATIMAEKEKKSYVKATRLLIIFFFRVYMSSRSLYRQVISLMPPKKSKEMANSMGDTFAACCGNDLVKKTEWNDESYFSWISRSSASILDTIKHISDIYLKDDSADCCLLTYTLQGLVLQRLVDLNRQIKSLDYISQMQENLIGDDETSRGKKKKIKKLNKHLLVLKREGEDLTDWLLSWITSGFDREASGLMVNYDQWGIRTSTINKKTLPSLLWWILSQHLDVWSSHAGKKKLKKFLLCIIHASIPFTPLIGEIHADEDIQTKKLAVKQYSSDHLCDSVLYEHEFVRRYLASSFSHILENTAVQFFKAIMEDEIIFDSSPDWSEALVLLENCISSSCKLPSKTCVEEDSLSVNSAKLTTCKSLLNLLYRMPKEYMTKKSLHKCASYVLEFERCIMLIMLRCRHNLSPVDQRNLFSLFITCRRTLKILFMTSCDKMVGATMLPLSDGSMLALWLLKSAQAAITCQGLFKNDCSSKARDFIVSLMDHTSYIFLAVTTYLFSRALPLFIAPKSVINDQPSSPESLELQKSMNVFDEDCDDSETNEESRRVMLVMVSLTEQAETLLIPLKDALGDGKTVIQCEALLLNKLSSVFSCFGGLLWGLASAASEDDMQKSYQKTKLRWKSEPFSNLSCSINVLSDFVEVLMNGLFQKDDTDSKESNGLVDVDIKETKYVNSCLLESLLMGESSEAAAMVLRELLITSAAVLRLNLHVDGITLSSSLISALTCVSYVLLNVLADMKGVPQGFSFIWLDGALKFLEELGHHFSSSDPTLNRDLYSKLIELHLKVIGKCISLQGKEAILASHETGFSTNVVHTKQSGKNTSHSLHWLEEFKVRLRVSFEVFIRNSSELHFLSCIQTIENALIGVSEICPAVYTIYTGDKHGGRISPTAAAAVDCLDLVLEHASGRKRFNVVKRHIQSMISAIFSIIVHLQSPFIFFSKPVCEEGPHYPDPGSAILMCVEVLTRVAGKHALFQMSSWRISQSIHIPAALFRNFLQVPNTNDLRIDREFPVSMYAASCRLLYTIVKHHKSETEGCIATLEESVSALLHCLEMTGNESTNPFSWKIEEGIRCACFLRRIYEELRHQKEVFKPHCFKFLSTYIWVSSGLGPLNMGIRREVDEALRPGVYALIDSCELHDLQYLHSIFGDGPCRNTLATLQKEYKTNFKYEGKV